jgi:single-strand DNA-binding protein
MSDINTITISGRLTSDPELRHTSKGDAVCNFRLASNRASKDSNGDKTDETTFIEVIAWKQLADIVTKHVHKGDRIAVTGGLRFEEWNDRETGVKRTKHQIRANEVTFLTLKES